MKMMVAQIDEYGWRLFIDELAKVLEVRGRFYYGERIAHDGGNWCIPQGRIVNE
jgi:hypothetical protein